nr:MAG TPA: hypothetical protein [Caudoviricetes sp.]
MLLIFPTKILSAQPQSQVAFHCPVVHRLAYC